MQFIQFPNGNVWRVSEQHRISGTVQVHDYENFESLEDRLDAISEAATGSCCGLTDFSYTYRGNDLVSFYGTADALPADEADFADEGYKVLLPGSPELAAALMAQYNLSEAEATHAVGSMDCVYENECQLDVVGSDRSIHTPAHPQDCDYVRIVLDGYELAYWTSNEWAEDPTCVMGAIFGAAKG